MQETSNDYTAPEVALRLVAASPRTTDLKIRSDLTIRPPMARLDLSTETVDLTGGTTRRPDEVVMGHRLPSGSIVVHRLGEPCTECDVL
jgi:hypothetical protein